MEINGGLRSHGLDGQNRTGAFACRDGGRGLSSAQGGLLLEGITQRLFSARWLQHVSLQALEALCLVDAQLRQSIRLRELSNTLEFFLDEISSAGCQRSFNVTQVLPFIFHGRFMVTERCIVGRVFFDQGQKGFLSLQQVGPRLVNLGSLGPPEHAHGSEEAGVFKTFFILLPACLARKEATALHWKNLRMRCPAHCPRNFLHVHENSEWERVKAASSERFRRMRREVVVNLGCPCLNRVRGLRI